MKTELIFVYNADSGVLNAMKDVIHKTVSRKTYPCKLCDLTYSFAGMRKEWKDFVNGLGYEVKFLHKDEFETNEPLPAAFLKDTETKLLVSCDEMNSCKTLQQLIDKVKEKVEDGS